MSDIQFRIIRERQKNTTRERYRIQGRLDEDWSVGHGQLLFGQPALFDDVGNARLALEQFNRDWSVWEFVEVVDENDRYPHSYC